MTPHSSASLELLRRFAPGTPLRTAAELIMAQGTGGLIVVGSGPRVDAVTTGGFVLDGARFTAQRLAELAKMDGGIVVDDRLGMIVAANVHFMPDPAIATAETGTRFRTAERIAVQTGVPVLAVSEEGHLRAVVFSEDTRFTLQSVTELLAEANQRLQSLERIRRQFDEALARLDRYESEDLVSERDVVAVLQRAAVIRAIARGLDAIAAETGDEAPLITLQAEALAEGVYHIADLVNADYQPRKPRKGTSVFRKLDLLDEDDLYKVDAIGDALGFTNLDQHVTPRGIRALADISRLPDSVRDAILRRFGTYDKLLSASTDQLAEVEGVGKARAKTIRSYLKGRQGLVGADLGV